MRPSEYKYFGCRVSAHVHQKLKNFKLAAQQSCVRLRIDPGHQEVVKIIQELALHKESRQSEAAEAVGDTQHRLSGNRVVKGLLQTKANTNADLGFLDGVNLGSSTHRDAKRVACQLPMGQIRDELVMWR